MSHIQYEVLLIVSICILHCHLSINKNTIVLNTTIICLRCNVLSNVFCILKCGSIVVFISFIIQYLDIGKTKDAQASWKMEKNVRHITVKNLLLLGWKVNEKYSFLLETKHTVAASQMKEWFITRSNNPNKYSPSWQTARGLTCCLELNQWTIHRNENKQQFTACLNINLKIEYTVL